MSDIRNSIGSRLVLLGHTETHVYYRLAVDPANIERVSAIKDALRHWCYVLTGDDERFIGRPTIAVLRHFILTTPVRAERARKAKKGRFTP